MSTCPTCGSPRVSKDTPCFNCAASNGRGATSESSRILNVDDSGAPDLISALEFDERESTRSGADDVRVDIRPRLEYSAVPGQADPFVNLLVDITPSGPPLLDPATSPVAHVILLLDVSASMNHPDKYPVLTEALTGMLADLASPHSADVLISVVLFAYGAKTLLRDVSARTLTSRDLLAKIDASPLRFGRYTDVAGALRRAEKIAVEQLIANKAMPTRVYLLTDGRPQDVDATREVMARIAKLPVDVEALAFGADADVALLQSIVSGGRGGTVKLVRSETLGDAFDRIAEVAQRVVSNRAIVDFELSPGVFAGAAYRYRPGRHRFDDDSFVGGTKFSTDLGAFESGRTYSLLFGVRLPESKTDRTDIGRIRLRLRGVDGPRIFEAAVSVPRLAGDALPEPDAEVVAARDVLAAMSGTDAKTQLRALRIRRKLYAAERRDPYIIGVIDRAIESLEAEGSLAGLSAEECATLKSHTCTAGGARPPAARREFAAG
jgi:uncharacterized protein YegL